MDIWEVILRLGAATLAGMAVGANRDLSHKPIGIRTLGLVSLGAAIVTLSTVHFGDLIDHPDALSRVVQGVIQGIMTGVSFIGAGVILRDRQAKVVHGLTTAATVWITAALGIACALASWLVAAAGVALALVLLLIVKRVEDALGFSQHDDESKGDF